MVDVDVELIGAAYYTGNCHKWMCAPKGAGFLHVREDRQQTIVPAVVSEGYGTGAGSGRFRAMFDWVGTDDVTPLLAVPAAIEHMAGMVGGGWAEVRRENRLLALAGREEVASALDVDQLPSAEFVGSMASLRLPDGPELVPGMIDPLEDQLFSAHGIEVPVVAWPEPGKRLVRLSAQRYNEIAQYRRLAAALAESFR